jgi:hypothetical protein
LAKVGFHYYLWTSEHHTGAEFPFQPIRNFIRHGQGDWRSFVTLTAPQFVGELAAGRVPECFSHFFGVGKQNGEILSAVQFFAGPEHLTPPSLIRLGVTRRFVASRYHWVSYYGEKVNGYDGEIMELFNRQSS